MKDLYISHAYYIHAYIGWWECMGMGGWNYTWSAWPLNVPKHGGQSNPRKACKACLACTWDKRSGQRSQPWAQGLSPWPLMDQSQAKGPPHKAKTRLFSLSPFWQKSSSPLSSLSPACGQTLAKRWLTSLLHLSLIWTPSPCFPHKPFFHWITPSLFQKVIIPF